MLKKLRVIFLCLRVTTGKLYLCIYLPVDTWCTGSCGTWYPGTPVLYLSIDINLLWNFSLETKTLKPSHSLHTCMCTYIYIHTCRGQLHHKSLSSFKICILAHTAARCCLCSAFSAPGSGTGTILNIQKVPVPPVAKQ